MKRWLCILLAAALLLSLVACGSETDVRGSIESAGPASSEAAEESEEQEQESEFESGLVSGLTYTNRYAGIQCVLGEGWRFYTDEEIAELNGFTKDSLSSEYAEQIENADLIYDMVAETADGSLNVNVVFEKLNFAQLLAFDEESYLDESMKGIVPALESMGCTDVSAEKTTVEFAGETRSAIAVSAMMSSVPVYEKLVVIKCSRHVCTVTVSAVENAATDEVMALFTPVYRYGQAS